MLLEDQRQLHEDLERLEDAAAERLLEDPPHVGDTFAPMVTLSLTCRQIRDRLARDHDIARYLEQMESQSSRLLKIYEDEDGKREDGDGEGRRLSRSRLRLCNGIATFADLYYST